MKIIRKREQKYDEKYATESDNSNFETDISGQPMRKKRGRPTQKWEHETENSLLAQIYEQDDPYLQVDWNKINVPGKTISQCQKKWFNTKQKDNIPKIRKEYTQRQPK